MWGESSQNCENNCQCSGLITDAFKINSGNGTHKRKQEEALSSNYKLRMNPHTIDFKSPGSPIHTPKRRILGEIQNSPLFRPKQSPVMERLKSSPLVDRISPLADRNVSSPVSTRTIIKRSSKISRIFEERSKFKRSNKENEESMISETFVKLDVEEETRDCVFGDKFSSSASHSSWSSTKLNFTDALQTKTIETTTKEVTTETTSMEPAESDCFVPEPDTEALDDDFETLHDLEEEFDNDNFDECTKYEIISTDSPNIISRGRTTTSRKVTSRNFAFGAPLTDSEASTSFNRPSTNANRMLNFEDESFEFTSPAARRPSSSFSVKKSLKFNETPVQTPTKNSLRHERSDSSIGSMTSSPSSSQIRLFTSESTTSMESGFISELEEPFLELEEASNSPKMANFEELLSGQIKDNIFTNKELKRPFLARSLSYNVEPRAKVSLFAINESTVQKNKLESDSENVIIKRRKSNHASPDVIEKVHRPMLQRCLSENHASIMSALARSDSDADLIGDFSVPYALPVIGGDHVDLKSITAETLASLMRGEYKESVEFQIIDCRYPYEFEGGHLPGALNLHTPELVKTLLMRPQSGKRSILVFHCEFSLERGPKLYRYLRSSDRTKNAENYPHLHYPEIYLLHKGYRSFYQKYPELCSPLGYTAMLDPKHTHMLKKHRSSEEPASFFTHHRSKPGHRLMY